MFKRYASAQWRGAGKDGQGTLNSNSGALNGIPYSVYGRFVSEDGKAGTNPEELIGAAHAGCFSMAFALQLDRAGFKADVIDTKAVVSLNKDPSGWAIKEVELQVEVAVPGLSEEKFREITELAKQNCPVSKALQALSIKITAKLRAPAEA